MKNNDKLIILTDHDIKEMINHILVLLPDFNFQRDGEQIILNVNGTMKFNFKEKITELVLESTKN